MTDSFREEIKTKCSYNNDSKEIKIAERTDNKQLRLDQLKPRIHKHKYEIGEHVSDHRNNLS